MKYPADSSCLSAVGNSSLIVARSDCGQKTAKGDSKGENLWLIGEFLVRVKRSVKKIP